MKYQKKPVVVDAFQMTKELYNNGAWPEWLLRAWRKKHSEEGAFWCLMYNSDCLYINTLEGVMRVFCGDWIIRGVRGELYPCKPDIFEETYGEVEDQENQRTLKAKIKGLQKLIEDVDIGRLQRTIAILDERDRQDELWGEQDHTLPEWMVILTEEVGELAAAVSDVLFHANYPEKNWREEAVQVAAVALAMLEQYQGTE